MNHPRGIVACLSFVLLLTPALGQEGRLVVVQPGAKELKRSAHRMRIPPEQLKNARAVLQEATELARKLDPAPLNAFGQLGEFWIQLHQSQAPGAIESIYTHLRVSAAKASEPQIYQQCTSAAQALLSALAELDSEKALQLIRQWPRPPASLGTEAEKLRSQLESQFQNQTAQRIVYRDPEAALKLLPNLDGAGTPSYAIRGQVVQQFARTGQKEEAAKIADQVMADFQQRNADPRAVQEFTTFIQNLSMLDSDRFQDAIGLLAPALARQVPVSGYGPTFKVGNQSVQLTPAESTILNVFRGLQGRPELAIKTLNTLPDLKGKLDRVGGLDSFLNPNIAGGPASRIVYSGDPREPAAALFGELRGKSRKDPGMVRTRLSEFASNPDHLDSLISVAQRASYEDPDLSSMALEAAAAHISQVEPLQRRAMFLQNLVRTYRQSEGEVDPALLRNGFVIADQLRQEEEQKNPDIVNVKAGFGTQADQLEAALVAEYARDNFDAAMRFMRSKPDDNIKLTALLRVLQALRSSY